MHTNESAGSKHTGHDDAVVSFDPETTIYVACSRHSNIGTFHLDPDCWTLQKVATTKATTYRHRPLRSEPCNFCAGDAE